MLQLLIKHGAEEIPTKRGAEEPETYLHTAARNGSTDVVKFAVESSSMVINSGPPTALYLACREGKFDCAKVLIDYQNMDVSIDGMKALRALCMHEVKWK